MKPRAKSTREVGSSTGSTAPKPVAHSQSGLESELKYELSPLAYQKLKRALRGRERWLTNAYFDDARLSLRRKDVGLRIRGIGDRRAVLTVKLPASTPRGSPAALKVRREFEHPIPLGSARAVLAGELPISSLATPGMEALRGRFPASVLGGLHLLGTLRMQRRTARLPDGYTAELDRFEVFGKWFYELEIETADPNGADSAARALFRRYHIRYRPLSLSKLGRFFLEWENEGSRLATASRL